MKRMKNETEGFGIYCHIPFCVKKCGYCDFTSIGHAGEEMIARYFEALHVEIKNTAKAYSEQCRAVDTIYLGGGTPSFVEATHIEATLLLIRDVFEVTADAEITIEINPGTLTQDKAQRYKEAGINRASVGLQAWQEELLKRIGRIHSRADFIEAIEDLQRAGFTNISADVMLGLPGQGLEAVRETVTALMDFPLTHLSCYSLTLEEGTLMEKDVRAGNLTLPDEDAERRMHWMVADYLEEKGYRHYEISNYAVPGFESRHNLKYWSLVPTLGFGLGAHGYWEGRRYANTQDLKEYLARLESNQSPSFFDPSADTATVMGEWLFLGLRKLWGVRDEAFIKRFGVSFFDHYGDEIEGLIQKGLLEQNGSLLRLTRRGQDFENQVSLAFAGLP